MPELMKKHHIDYIELTFQGPLDNRKKAVEALKELDFIDTSDSIPWRKAFKRYDEANEAGIFLAGSRHKMNYTQKKLSELSGISQRHISEMENGKRIIDKENAVTLAGILKTDYRVFMQYEGANNSALDNTPE